MSKGKTIFIDDKAYELLVEQKDILRMNGFGKPSFSDAIRLACGKIKVEYTEEVK